MLNQWRFAVASGSSGDREVETDMGIFGGRDRNYDKLQRQAQAARDKAIKLPPGDDRKAAQRAAEELARKANKRRPHGQLEWE